MHDLTYKKALELKEHLLAIGETSIYLRCGPELSQDDLPWSKVTKVENGSSWRLDMPSSVRFIVDEAGLTFQWSMDLEKRDASGRGVHMFDRERIRFVTTILSSTGRVLFVGWLQRMALPALKARTAEIRHALSVQLDSEDCIRGLIAFASEVAAGEPEEAAPAA